MQKRRISQITSLIALHSSFWAQAPLLQRFCNPVLSCHSCVLSWFACPIGVMMHLANWQVFPFIALGTMLLVGSVVGRLLCGWVCPFGFVQDLLYKIPSRKFVMPEWSRNFKYAMLFGGVLIVPMILGAETNFSFCRICPAAALQVSIPNLFMSHFAMPSTTTLVRFGFLFGFVGLAVMSSRSFCRTFCPIAAILAPLNYVSMWIVKPPMASACLDCGKCDKSCPTDIKPSERIKKEVPVNRHSDCVVCHDCQNACPQRR